MKLPAEIRRVFIDGVKRPLTMDHYYKEFMRAEEHYLAQGCVVLTPFGSNIKLALSEGEEQEYPNHRRRQMGHQLFQQSSCDALILLPSWELDCDVRLKIAFATHQGMPIIEAYSHRYILAEVDLTPNCEYITLLTNTAMSREQLN